MKKSPEWAEKSGGDRLEEGDFPVADGWQMPREK